MERLPSAINECSRRPCSSFGFSSAKSFNFKINGGFERKIAIKLFKSYPKLKEKPYWENHFWACGYFVSTVGLDEETIKPPS